MKSFNGNTMHSNVVAEDTSYVNNPSTNDVIYAQTILKRLDSRSKEEIVNLANSLYNGVVETNLTNGWFLQNATNVVIDWNENIDRSAFAKLDKFVRGYQMIDQHLNWQEKFVDRLKKNNETNQIYIFNENSMLNIWISVDEPSTDIIYKYSNIYMEFLIENIEAVFEFMVFKPEEISEYAFPEKTIIINCEE